MITLYNVIDIRSWTYYSIAIVKKRNAKWLIPAEGGED